MYLPRSSIARLGWIILTVALCLVGLKRGSSFWVGVLTTLTGYWLLVAIAGTMKRPGRAFPLGFATFCIASLIFSFGPWSDREDRTCAVASMLDSNNFQISPVSYVLARLTPYIEPEIKGSFTLQRDLENPMIAGEFWIYPASRPKSFMEGANATGRLSEAWGSIFHQQTGSAQGITTCILPVMMPEYQDAGHLVADLIFGLIGGFLGLGISQMTPYIRKSRPSPSYPPLRDDDRLESLVPQEGFAG